MSYAVEHQDGGPFDRFPIIWYGPDMSQAPTSRREDRGLLVAAYLTLAAVAVIGLLSMYQAGDRWEIAAGLLLAFGLLQARAPQLEAADWQIHLFLAAQTCLVCGLLVLNPSQTVFQILFFVLSPQAMASLPGPLGMLWIAVFTLVTGMFSIYSLGWPEGLLILSIFAGGYLFFGIFGQALARADAARRESQALLRELEEAHRQLGAYADRVEELAVVDERNRLAREMHDTLGHRLTVAAVQLEGAQRLIPQDPERAVGMVGVVREQVSEALSELRRTVATLRAPVEKDLHLRQALRRLANHYEQATGTTVHLMLPDQRPELSDVHRMALYRAAQEALTNAQRHARARDVWLQLTQHDAMIALMVGDNGIGLGVGDGSSGFGLRGLRERAAQLGGEFFLEPRPGGGTQLHFRLPLSLEGGDG
jgi:signal transduction histidine kinase